MLMETIMSFKKDKIILMNWIVKICISTKSS